MSREVAVSKQDSLDQLALKLASRGEAHYLIDKILLVKFVNRKASFVVFRRARVVVVRGDHPGALIGQ